MDEAIKSGLAGVAGHTDVERVSERELVVQRVFDAPVHLVFQAWSRADLFKRWWIPESAGINLLSCELDVRTGGTYRLEFGVDAENSVSFYGKYLDVVPNARIVWTNDEGEEGPVTTVTFEEKDGKTHLVLRDLYPSKEALDDAMASGSISGYPEQFAQLEALLVSPG